MPLGTSARVRAAEPSRVQLGHQPHWQIETDPDKTSEVEVRFIAEGPTARASSSNTATSTATARAGKRARDGVGGDQGWPLYLDRFAKLLA